MAMMLHQLEPVHLTAAFIPKLDYDRLWSFSSSEVDVPLVGGEEDEVVKKHIENFEAACKQYQVKYQVRNDYLGFAVPELKRETRFSDLLLLGGESFFQGKDNDLNDYVKETLRQSECPAMVVPEEFYFPRNIILAYDGTASSVFAIKQFAYLFPEMCSYPAILVYSEEEEENIPHKEDIELLARLHFPNLKMIKLDADPANDFKDWINERRRSLLVTGAFGRSTFAQMFRKSFIEDILQESRLPVFISHI